MAATEERPRQGNNARHDRHGRRRPGGCQRLHRALGCASRHREGFHTDVTTVQWVINGYAMVFGVLIVTGGRLADMFGRRRIFIIGAAIFAGFSVIGGLHRTSGCCSPAASSWALAAR